MKKMLCFDMDGTIADLYGVDDWLKDLMNENPYPYTVAKPLCDIEELNTVLNKLIEQGWEIRVISWLAKDSSNSYKTVVRDAKRTWLAKYNFPAHKVHLVEYGTTKANCVRKHFEPGISNFILIDDNKSVRDGWHLGETIEPHEDLPTALWRLVE